ncbi:MAG: hypothetical protein HKM89_13600, partial [Gemmatimonadales bacterium]|nr:hypothetical protein [Gemmatimonadales bacterium]
MKRHFITSALALCVLVLWVEPALSQTEQTIGSDWTGSKDREFDFWVGEWDVNLRVMQSDHSFKDTHRAKAKIYRVLDGKAILELWDQQVEGHGIRGFSLRHYDPQAENWTLYLNWPGRNRSGMSSLTGSFRHGRGEFFST